MTHWTISASTSLNLSLSMLVSIDKWRPGLTPWSALTHLTSRLHAGEGEAMYDFLGLYGAEQMTLTLVEINWPNIYDNSSKTMYWAIWANAKTMRIKRVWIYEVHVGICLFEYNVLIYNLSIQTCPQTEQLFFSVQLGR